MITKPNQVICKVFKKTVSSNYEQVNDKRLPIEFMAKKLSIETTTTDKSSQVPKLVKTFTIGVDNDLEFELSDIIEIDNHKWRIAALDIKPSALNKMKTVSIIKLQRG